MTIGASLFTIAVGAVVAFAVTAEVAGIGLLDESQPGTRRGAAAGVPTLS